MLHTTRLPCNRARRHPKPVRPSDMKCLALPRRAWRVVQVGNKSDFGRIRVISGVVIICGLLPRRRGHISSKHGSTNACHHHPAATSKGRNTVHYSSCRIGSLQNCAYCDNMITIGCMNIDRFNYSVPMWCNRVEYITILMLKRGEENDEAGLDRTSHPWKLAVKPRKVSFRG